MIQQLARFLRDEDGPTAVEYAVLLALILIAMIVAVSSLGSASSGLWAQNINRITSAIGS